VCAVLFVLAARAVHAQQAAPTQAAPQAQGPVSTPAQPPVPNRLNQILPSWLRVRGEFRGRLEGFDGLGFAEGRDDTYYLNRVRLNAIITPSKSLSFQVQAQDARVAKKEIGPVGAPFKATFDLRTAFADVGAATSPVGLRVGRQELTFGDQRLVGHAGWLNAARTFDGVRLTVRRKTFQVDAFGVSLVRILDGEFDKSGNGNRFFGAYVATTALIPKGSFEPYLFWRGDRNLATESGPRGDMKLTTIGARMAGKLPASFEYNIENALQTGSVGADAIAAWAGHYQVKTPAGPRALRAVGEFNYASGDADPKDGKRGTFDQLYASAHDKYGLADQVGWRNVRHVRAGIEFSPVKALSFSTSYHSYWLAEKRDGLYAASGALLARVAAGAASSHVGQEIDVQGSRPLTPQLQLAAGYAHIFPGGFLKQATPGASYSFPFVMVTYVFLAEK